MPACPRCGGTLDDGPERLCPACEPTIGPHATVAAAPRTTAPSAAAAPTAAPAGRTLGRYRLLAPLGSGGMGVVWKAEDETLRRTVALKLIRPEGAGGEEALARFEREAHLAARLRHPGIVAVHDVGTADGQRYIAMEYVEGRTFAAWLSVMRDRPAAERRRAGVELLAAIAEAVAHAHAEGIIHRDLKPGNVLLDRDDRPHVMDFGLAREVAAEAPMPSEARLTLSGQVLGTPAYMSPEQAGGESARIGPHTDVWALGAMLHEVLTGAVPFVAGGVWETVRAVLLDEVAPPRKSDPTISAGLEAVCLRALEKEPEQRYAGAAEFAAELRRWLAGKPVLARPAGRFERARRWLKRRRGAVAAMAVVLLLIAATLGWTAFAGNAADQRALERLLAVRADLIRVRQEMLRTPLTAEARSDLAAQSGEVLAGYLAIHPTFGPALAWRGELLDLRGDLRGAEADFDRACGVAPEQAVVWMSRAVHRFNRYLSRGAIPSLVGVKDSLTFEIPIPEPDRPRRLEEALADVARMEAAPFREPWIREPDTRLVRATAEYYRAEKPRAGKVLPILQDEDDPEAWRLRGLAYYCDMRFADAEAAFARALAAAPCHDDARRLLGMTRFARALESWVHGHAPGAPLDAAIEDYGAVLRRDDDQPALHADRALALHLRADWKSHEGEDAREDYRAVLQELDHCAVPPVSAPWIARHRSEARAGLAEAMAFRGEDARELLEASIRELDVALQREPGAAPLLISRGKAEVRLGEAEVAAGVDPQEHFARATADFAEVLARLPADPEALAGRGVIRLRTAQARTASGQDPGDLLRLAEDDFTASLAAWAKPAHAWRNRAQCRILLARAAAARREDPSPWYGKAIDDFTEALNRQAGAPDRMARADAFDQRSRASAAAGRDPLPDLRAAVDDWSAALAAGAGGWEALAQRGEALVRIGQAEAPAGADPRPRFRNAIADYDAAVRLNPPHAVLLNARANARLNLGDATSAWNEDPGDPYRDAEADFRAAIAAGYARAWFNLGLLFRTLERVDDERAAYAQGLATAPERAAWVEARERESEPIRVLADQPWAREWRLGALSLQFGRRDIAQERYERGFALLAGAWQDLAADERARREAEPNLSAAIVNAHYALACLESLRAQGAERAARLDSAFAHLAEMARLGWKDWAMLRKDDDLKIAREDERFERLAGGKK